jgi:hypothetical protein
MFYVKRLFPMPRAALHRVRNVLLAASIAPIALVSGCAEIENDIRSVIVADGTPEGSSPLPPAALPKLKPGQTMPEMAAADPAAADEVPVDEAVPETLPPPPTKGADPELLVGMDEGTVAATLGPPSAVREVPPAKIWHYSVSDCVVSVYFYLNLESQLFQVLRYEIVPRPTSTVDGPTCYARLNQVGHLSQNNEG